MAAATAHPAAAAAFFSAKSAMLLVLPMMAPLLYAHLLWVQEEVDNRVTYVGHIFDRYLDSLFFPIGLQCFVLLHLSKSNKSITENE